MAPTDLSKWFAIGMGVIGGAVIASWGYEHMFVHGLTRDEKRNLGVLGAGALLTYGIVKLAKLDERLMTTEGVVQMIGGGK